MFKPTLKTSSAGALASRISSSLWSLAAITLSLTASAQVSCQWTADTSQASPVSFDIYQGETINLAPAYKTHGTHASLTSITAATFYWQTTGMENTWWSKPATIIPGTPDRVRAIFAPTNDCGAPFYTFFIRAATPAGSSYRANGTLIMRPSPGFIPATLPSPSIYPTLAAQIAPYVISELPPYDPLGSALAVSQTLAQAIENIEVTGGTVSNITNRVDKLWSGPANYVDGSLTFKKIDNPKYILTYSLGMPSDVGKVYTWEHTTISDGADGHPVGSVKEQWQCATNNQIDTLIYWSIYGWAIDDYVWEGAPEYITAGDRRAATLNLTDADGVTILLTFQREDVVVITDRAVTTNGTIIVTGQQTNALGIVTGQTARAGSQIINSKFSGGVDLSDTPDLRSVLSHGNHTSTNVPSIDTNAVISARDDNTEKTGLYGSGTTRPGVEAYSTYAPAIIARSATGPGGLFIQGPVSNSVGVEITGILKIIDEPTANEGAGQPGGITLNNRTIHDFGEIEAQIDADDIASLNAWGRRLPDGQPNAAADTAVVINSPMIIASGMGFETSGAYAVCVTSGAEMQVVTNGGWCCIRPSDWPDGIGFETVTVTIPAVANSFQVHNGGQTNGWARMQFEYTLGETNAPPVVYSADLLTWNFAPEQQSTHNGTNWTVTVSATEPKMFFKGQSRSGQADHIYSAYPHEFKQGVAIGALTPVVFDSVITLEYGGKTYRIPAEEQ